MIPIIILDFETSGLNPYHDDIIEIGAKELNKDNTLSVLLRPKSNEMISQEITTLTGITNRMLVNEGLAWEAGYSKLAEWLFSVIQSSEEKKIAIIAHNGETFDFIFLKNIFSELRKLQIKTPSIKDIIFIDTLLFAKRLLPNRGSYRQETLCQSFNIPTRGGHRALNDVIALEQLYVSLSQHLDKQLDSRRNVLDNPHMVHDYIHFKK